MISMHAYTCIGTTWSSSQEWDEDRRHGVDLWRSPLICTFYFNWAHSRYSWREWTIQIDNGSFPLHTARYVSESSHKISCMSGYWIGGDQLTVTRVWGSKQVRNNSERKQDCLEGLVPVVEDWHAKWCFLTVRRNSVSIYIYIECKCACRMQIYIYIYIYIYLHSTCTFAFYIYIYRYTISSYC